MSDSMVNRRWIFARRPEGALQAQHFVREVVAPPVAGPGELLVRNLYLSIDAGVRAWMSPIPTYRAPLAPGQVMEGFGLAEVIDSHAPGFAPGDLVEAAVGWQDISVVRATAAVRRDRKAAPEILLSVLSGAGLTAYFGLLEVGRPRPGETVVVSAAAGAVGSLAAQIARIAGCRSVGVAGGAEKRRWLVEHLGLDAAADYKGGRLADELREACPAGIDVFFDNTGGEVLETVLPLMNVGGRIVCCGAVAIYDQATPAGGTAGVPYLLITRRLRMEGFIVSEHLHRRRSAEAALSRWVEEGRLRPCVEVIDGFDHAPEALVGLLRGAYRGRVLV